MTRITAVSVMFYYLYQYQCMQAKGQSSFLFCHLSRDSLQGARVRITIPGAWASAQLQDLPPCWNTNQLARRCLAAKHSPGAMLRYRNLCRYLIATIQCKKSSQIDGVLCDAWFDENKPMSSLRCRHASILRFCHFFPDRTQESYITTGRGVRTTLWSRTRDLRSCDRSNFHGKTRIDRS
jgi:hypothetical protein